VTAESGKINGVSFPAEQHSLIQEELERVLHSEALRHSEQHRLLLSFLVQKSIEQRGDELKEYSVGIDALKKPESYSPRRDATVRIQVGRLRTRLEEYYKSEGARDPIIFDLPKGGFKVLFQNRRERPPDDLAPVDARLPERRSQVPLPIWICLGLSVLLAAMFGLIARFETARADRVTRLSESLWTPELEAIWSNSPEDKRSLTLSLGTPLFVSLNGIVIRDARSNLWQDDKLPPGIDRIRQALKATDIRPNYDYNGFGETVGALRLYRLLVSRGWDVTFRRSDSLSWDDFKERDVILLGSPKSISHLKSFRDLRIKLAFDVDESRIVNYEPARGEAASYARSPLRDTKYQGVYDGYALVTRLPGVDGAGNLMILGSPNTEGTQAACEYVTSPQGAKELTRELARGGKLPIAYQVLLKVAFQAGVPLTINCIAHRSLKSDPTAVQP
jgi:hypothetical protein